MLSSQQMCKTSKVIGAFIGFGLLMCTSLTRAATLEDIRFAELPGERFEVRMDFSSVPDQPAGYTIEQPARIVLDFPGVVNALKERKFPLSFGNAKSAVVLSTDDRTRLILNLSELVLYTSRIEGNSYIVEVGAGQSDKYLQTGTSVANKITGDTGFDSGTAITNIDFRRGDDGEGKIIVNLSDPNVAIDVEQVSGGMAINFRGASLPENLRRTLDVIDFATPVSSIRSELNGGDTVLTIQASGEYDYLAYQADNEYVVSVKQLTKEELIEKNERFAFVGEKLSLNFQDIEVRSVLQLIADFTELNLVASDTVTGSITLRLDNVPWDHALDLVLKAKGLDKRQVGNVLMVAPAAEIAERERQELETRKQIRELAPLRTEFITLNYANAADFLDLVVVGNGDGEGSDKSESILSSRGSAIVDKRTNSIVMTDIDEKIENFKRLLKKVDVPVRQVQIEARIVIASTDFRKELGVRWANANISTAKNGKHRYLQSGNLESMTNDNFDDETGAWTPDLDDATMVDLGVGAPAAALTMSMFTDNGLLSLELSALQSNGHAEIVSQPKVITGDKQQAHIESGTEIAYQEASASGATSTSFKEAVLKLDVTPQITPDDKIIMKLVINKDAFEGLTGSGIPTIAVNELATQVLVGNGQTVVLGGIFESTLNKSESKVPFLGDLPYVGRLFRTDVNREEKRELLIFITPKILADNLAE